MPAQLYDQPNVPWTTAAAVILLPWFADLGPLPNATLDRMVQVASAWLWRMSGRQFSGPASTTVRPVPSCTSWGLVGRGLVGTFDSRTGMYGGGWGGAGRREGAYEILLGHTPVRSVDQVVIDGAILPASTGGVPNYRLDDARWLVRTDGQPWPSVQDWSRESPLGAPGEQAGTWQVTLTWGEDPPPDGVYAAQILAGELTLAGSDSGECRLPRNVQSVTRQGTSMLMMDPSTLLTAGKWGVPEIDFFIASVNPNQLTQPAAMTSPDIGRAVRRAGTLPGS